MKKSFVLFPIIFILLFCTYCQATVADATYKSTATCNGTATEYPFTFGIGETSEVKATATVASTGVETVLTETTDYTVSCTNSDCSAGGTVVLTAGSKCPSGSTLTLEMNVPYTQESDFIEGMPTLYETFEDALDKLTRIVQQLKGYTSRAPLLPTTSTTSWPTLENPVAGQYLRWNLTGTGIDSTSSSNNLGTYTASGTGATARSIDSKLYESLSVKDFCSTVDGTTDNATCFQAAINAAIAAGKDLFVPAGTYMLQSALTVTNGGTKGFRLHGAGQHATILLTPATGSTGALTTGALITWTCTGYSTTISDMTVTADTGGNTNIDGLLVTGSNGVNVDKMWFSSFHEGLKIASDSSNIRVSRIESEYNTMGLTVSASDMCTFSDIHTYRNSSCGIYNTGTPTLSIAGTAQGNSFFNLSLFEDGYGGDGSGASFYNESTTPYAIDNITAGSYGDTVFPYTGIYNAAGHAFGTINNPLIMMASRRGIYHLAGNLYVNGGKIDKTGYYDQSTPWATNGIFAGSGATSLKVRGTWINSEGNGIHTQAVWTELDGLTLYDCSSGGSTGSVNATTGVYSVLFDPQTTEHRFRLSNSHFYTSGGTGKTALRFNATATPANAGDVKLANNSVSYDTTDFDARFSTAIANASMLTYDYSNNKSLIVTEASGSSSIPNSATSVDVTHGLGITPNAEHITIIGKENPTNTVGTIWVDTIGATTFKVNVENDPGASNWDFAWKAIIK